MQDKRDREANRGVRKSMKECIKLGNVIDDDVKECTEGLRENVVILFRKIESPSI